MKEDLAKLKEVVRDEIRYMQYIVSRLGKLVVKTLSKVFPEMNSCLCPLQDGESVRPRSGDGRGALLKTKDEFGESHGQLETAKQRR